MFEKFKLMFCLLRDSRRAVDMIIEVQSELEDLRRKNDSLFVDRSRLSRKNAEIQERLDAIATRNTQMEYNARASVSESVLAQAHAIDPNTRLLIITTADKNVATAATFANLNNKISRICKNLDAMIMVSGVADIEQLSTEEAAKKYGIVAIPDRTVWEKSSDMVLTQVAKLFDTYSKSKNRASID